MQNHITPDQSRRSYRPDIERSALLPPSDLGLEPCGTFEVAEGQPLLSMAEASDIRLVTSGWAAYTHDLSGQRRQILQFVLPGDLLMADMPFSRQIGGPTALTRVSTTSLRSPSFRATQQARALADCLESGLLHHLMRIGRMSAYERLLDMLVELHDRLASVGLAGHGSFEFPLTQSCLADALGLSTVHVNRTLQQLKADGRIAHSGSIVTILARGT